MKKRYNYDVTSLTADPAKFAAAKAKTELGKKIALIEKKPLSKGFSLIELLVVIAVIALLLSIIMPTLRNVQVLSKRLRCAYNLKQIDLAMHMYLNDYDNTYPCAQDPMAAGHWLWMGRGWRSLVEPYLTDNIDPNNPSVLFCPEDRVSKEKYESTSYAYSMTFYHSSEQIDDMNSPLDTYQDPKPSIPQQSSNVTNPSGKILIGEWLSCHFPVEDDTGWWCWKGARNFLFADGQVSFISAEQIRPARDGLPDANLTIKGIKGTDYPP